MECTEVAAHAMDHLRPAICRVCMQPTEPDASVNIFECKIPETGYCLSELVALVGAIEVRPDELPEWCCYRCQLDVAQAYRVRILCQESDRKLREALLVEDVVPEVDDRFKVEVEEPMAEFAAERPCEEMDENQKLREPEAMEPAEMDMAWKFHYDRDCSGEDADPDNRESGVFEEINVVDQVCCCTCRIIFNNLKELLEHAERTHAVEDPPKDNKTMKFCRICYKLIGRKHYQKHIRAPKKMYRCKTCAELFLTMNKVYKHYLREHNITKNCCGLGCGAVFESAEALQQHSDQVHLPAKRSPDPLRPAVCPVCYRTFKTYRFLYSHRTRPDNYKCTAPNCTELFRTQKSLKLHMLTHNRDPKNRCKPCDKSYRDPRDLLQHNINIHGFRGPHGCDLCPASFAKPTDLSRHKRICRGTGQQNQKTAMDAGGSGLMCKVEPEEPKLAMMKESEEEEDDEVQAKLIKLEYH